MGVRGQYEHLASPAATEEDVLDYLAERSAYITEQGGTATPLNVYWREGDLERYRMAEAVWAKDAPPRFALPDLPTMLNGVAGPAGMAPATFMADMESLWHRYAAWMVSVGRDPSHANETPDQRRARKARESMARTRERRSGDCNPERQALLSEAKRLYDVYLEACRTRAQVVAEQTALVATAKANHEAAQAAAKG